jgi:general nucleoside transport system permease protein
MKTLKLFLSDLALVLTAVAVSVLVVMIGLWLAGYPAGRVVADWIAGAIGSRFDLLAAMKNACPLMLTGLAAGIAFRCGVFNIGGEGQSLLGAIASAAVATRLIPGAHLPCLAIPTALAAAALGGALWGMVAAALDRLRGVPIVLSTILLNIIAVQLLGAMVEGPLQEVARQNPQSDKLPEAFWLPMLSVPLHAGIVIAVTVALAAWIVQARTTFGFEIRAVGLNVTAARLAGMPVTALQFSVMAVSGAFAGLAGGVQVMGVEGHFLGASAPGYGYAGIAVALLGRLHPAGIVVAALFFGLLDQGATHVEISRYELPHEVADIVKGLMVLLILLGAAYVGRLRMMARAGAER